MLAINQKHKGLKKTKKDPLEVRIPSLKLAESSPLKMDGWKINFLLGWPNFRGELLVSGGVNEHEIC